MGYGSSSRGNARVIWICLHTAEGARTARALAHFFDGNSGASSHAACDASEIVYMVPRARAAWTLGPGNPYSMNLEMCGFARWSRAQWHSTGTVDGCASPRAMIRQAARWARAECDHFGIPYHRVGIPAVSGWRESVIHHDDYTRGSGWGSHWDAGPNFPWDTFFADLTGGAAPADDPGGGLSWPLPAGHYYGPVDGPERSHGGYYPAERPIVRLIQQAFQRLGHAPSYPGWADGIWEQPTTDACRAWERASGRKTDGIVTEADWHALFPEQTTQAGGIESMALDTEFTDWADNPQTVRSWMNHVDRRVYRILDEIQHRYPSTVEGSTYTAPMGQMATNADGYGYRTQQRLDDLEGKVDQILDALQQRG